MAMKLGASPKKVAILAVLLVILGYVFYTNVLSGPSGATAPRRTAAPRATPTTTAQPRPTRKSSSTNRASRRQAFRPTFGAAGDAELDPAQVDPTLRTDLLAALRDVKFEGVSRNIFRFGKKRVVTPPPDPRTVAAAQGALDRGPREPPKPTGATQPTGPRAPKIPLRYYGVADSTGHKRAFLLDGEEVLVGGEGDILKKRYKIERITNNEIEMSDLQYKDAPAQKLPMQQS